MATLQILGPFTSCYHTCNTNDPSFVIGSCQVRFLDLIFDHSIITYSAWMCHPYLWAPDFCPKNLARTSSQPHLCILIPCSTPPFQVATLSYLAPAARATDCSWHICSFSPTY